MLEIIHQTTEENFDLSGVTKLPFEFRNPAVSDKGSLSVKVSLPASAINCRLTEYPNQTGGLNTEIKVPVYLVVFGERKPCTMLVMSATKHKIETSLFYDESDFILQYGDVMLPDLLKDVNFTYPWSESYDFENPSAVQLPPYSDEVYDKIYPDVQVAFPLVYNSEFFDYIEEGDPKLNYKYCAPIINHPSTNKPSANKSFDSPTVPCPFYNFVISEIFKAANKNITSNFFLNSMFENLIFITNTRHQFINISEFLLNDQPKNIGRLKHFVPPVTVKDFFNEFNIFNTHIHERNGDVELNNFDEILKKPTSIVDYFYQLKKKNHTPYTGFSFISAENTFFKSEGINEYYKYSDIKDSILENRIFTRTVWGHDLIGNEIIQGDYNSISVSSKEGVLLSEIRMVSNGVDEQIDLYKLEYEKTYGLYLTWYKIGILEFDEYHLGDQTNALEYKSKISSIKNEERSFELFGDDYTTIPLTLNLPIFNAVGYTNENIINREKAFQLAFYLGKQSQNDYIYPLALNKNKVSNETLDLSWHSEKGLVSTLFSETMNFHKNKKPYEALFYMPIRELFNFNFATPYHIQGGRFIVELLKGYITITGRLDGCKAELLEY